MAALAVVGVLAVDAKQSLTDGKSASTSDKEANPQTPTKPHKSAIDDPPLNPGTVPGLSFPFHGRGFG
jgi:hypothetical protein